MFKADAEALKMTDETDKTKQKDSAAKDIDKTKSNETDPKIQTEKIATKENTNSDKKELTNDILVTLNPKNLNLDGNSTAASETESDEN